MNAPDSQADAYVFITCVNPEGKLTAVASENARYQVSIARPRPNTTTERDLEEVLCFTDQEAAGKSFIERMRATGLPGVLDMCEMRVFADKPVDFCARITEKIWDKIDEQLEEDAEQDVEERVDDFDCYPLSPLREGMVDACPEFGGEDLPRP